LALAHDVPVEVDLDQVGGGDLAVVEPVGVDQETILFSGHLHGYVAVDELVPAQQIEDAVHRRELLASLALIPGQAEPERVASRRHQAPSYTCRRVRGSSRRTSPSMARGARSTRGPCSQNGARAWSPRDGWDRGVLMRYEDLPEPVRRHYPWPGKYLA